MDKNNIWIVWMTLHNIEGNFFNSIVSIHRTVEGARVAESKQNALIETEEIKKALRVIQARRTHCITIETVQE